MSETVSAQGARTTIDLLLDVLRDGKEALIRSRKSDIQKDFMIARRVVQATYEGFPPEDLPVDLQRLIRDLEVERDQKVSDAIVEIKKSYATAETLIKGVAESHPALYHVAPKPKAAGVVTPAGTPDKVFKVLGAEGMKNVVRAMIMSDEGISLANLCQVLKLTSPPEHMATKRFLTWLRDKGHAKTQGPGGKGTRYVATPSAKKLIPALGEDEQPEAEG